MSSPRVETPDIPEGLLNDPIGWFLTEHRRHRQFCELMRRAASQTTFDEELITWLLDFVVHELAEHIGDEEQVFFPLLRTRALPEDHLEEVLGRLSNEHAKDLGHAHSVQKHLEVCLSQRAPVGRAVARRRALEAFADQELRHLALENAVILPLARLRLASDDVVALGRSLAARRGFQIDALN